MFMFKKNDNSFILGLNCLYFETDICDIAVREATSSFLLNIRLIICI